ncbi:unnamed protein product [Darwinula stevensoni]|uniref:EGF-like domain-containing protein n=1 Tax=Darwinula stevensoni TaxID=69355 RepID=A0A7R8WYA5_9CRUS|nr:unnamed protein product [Darwinula stevensoni]CAG0879117.1 unnamed protein product [Darwinula stevensoni]
MAMEFVIEDNMEVAELPEGLFGALSFQGIHIWNTAVKKVHPTAMLPLKQFLTYLAILDSRLENFPFNMLHQFQHLRELWLYNNLLTFVPAFKSDSLEILSLRANKITSVEFDGWATPKLREFGIARNPLSRLPSAAIKSMKNLEKFYSSECNLGPTLSRGVLEFQSKALQLITLWKNDISELDQGAITGLGPNTTVRLTNNKIAVLSEESFRPMLDILSKGDGVLHLDESEIDNADPCLPNPCGAHANCQASGGHPMCSCIYYGDPETGCIEGECVETHDCSDDRVCNDFYCTDPCPGTCGTGAQCIVRRHVPSCTCPAGHTGDPFERCRRLDPGNVSPHASVSSVRPFARPVSFMNLQRTRAIRRPAEKIPSARLHPIWLSAPAFPISSATPTKGAGEPFCRLRKGNRRPSATLDPVRPATRVISSRRNGKIHPFYFFRRFRKAECETDSACAQTQECRQYKCMNPCTDACGENAECRVEHHRAICSCPKDFLGDPRTHCYAECTVHEDCAYHKACVHFRCKDPCVGACGMNAECRVENHKAICSCPEGSTGHPSHHCKPLNPGLFLYFSFFPPLLLSMIGGRKVTRKSEERRFCGSRFKTVTGHPGRG